MYKSDPFISKISKAAAEIDISHTRAQETIAFAKKIGAKTVGISACIALIKEAKNFAKILDAHGIDNYCVNCKVGSIKKSEIGIIDKGCACNPILQAEILNKQETDLNVIMGLCIGHDSLFIKHSNAIVTTLIVKDRVLKHNPVTALQGL